MLSGCLLKILSGYKKLSECLGVAFTTAQRAINVLVEKGVLSQVDNAQRDRCSVRML